MIGFGELNRKAREWQTDIGTVDRIYALNWLLKGIFAHPSLRDKVVCGGATALCCAYFASYPRTLDLDLVRLPGLEDTQLEQAIGAVLTETGAWHVKFRLHSFKSTEARVEFTGPLGRRSAAQPSIVIRFHSSLPRLETVVRPLLHPFSDECRAALHAVALDEIAAERLVLYGGKPRARDVYDLWFILTHALEELDPVRIRQLAEQFAREKGTILNSAPQADYLPFLEKAWDNALKDIPGHPPFFEANTQLSKSLAALGF